MAHLLRYVDMKSELPTHVHSSTPSVCGLFPSSSRHGASLLIALFVLQAVSKMLNVHHVLEINHCVFGRPQVSAAFANSPLRYAAECVVVTAWGLVLPYFSAGNS